jgi:hypothetical protein
MLRNIKERIQIAIRGRAHLRSDVDMDGPYNVSQFHDTHQLIDPSSRSFLTQDSPVWPTEWRTGRSILWIYSGLDWRCASSARNGGDGFHVCPIGAFHSFPLPLYVRHRQKLRCVGAHSRRSEVLLPKVETRD